jgi:hypothetical protein
MGVSICIDYTDYLTHRENWNYAILNFPVQTLYVHRGRNEEDISGKLTKDAIYINEVDELPADKTLVLLAPKRGDLMQGNEPLSGFAHPGDVVYYFGTNGHSVLPEHFARRAPSNLVYIDHAAHRDMWSWMAWVIVAYDRLTKIRSDIREDGTVKWP